MTYFLLYENKDTYQGYQTVLLRSGCQLENNTVPPAKHCLAYNDPYNPHELLRQGSFMTVSAFPQLTYHMERMANLRRWTQDQQGLGFNSYSTGHV